MSIEKVLAKCRYIECCYKIDFNYLEEKIRKAKININTLLNADSKLFVDDGKVREILLWIYSKTIDQTRWMILESEVQYAINVKTI